MNKTERTDQERHFDRLRSLGLSFDDIYRLRRIARTLQRWHERECGVSQGHIERDDVTNRPRFRSANSGNHWPILDLESAALKHLSKLMAAHPALIHYVQRDPRDAPLYILRRSDLDDGAAIESVYTRGVCVY